MTTAWIREFPGTVPRGEMHKAEFWLNGLAEDWRGEVPMRLHSAGHFGLGSAPPFSPEFVGYIGRLECNNPNCQECGRKDNGATRRWRNDEGRWRATKAFRRLRAVAPREFDALYLYCILRWDVSGIAKALTDRAIRLNKPERYTAASVVMLLFSGIDKVQKWW